MSASIKVSKLKVCPIVGKFKSLRHNTIPSIKNVLSNYLLEKDKLIAGNECTRNIHSVAFLNVLESLLIIWSNHNIPTVLRKRIAFLFDKFNKQRLELLKSYKRDKNKPAFKAKLNYFARKCNVMFDIRDTKGSTNASERLLNENEEVDSIDGAVENIPNVESDKSRKCKKLPEKPFPLRNRNRLNLPTVSSLLDRYKVSNVIGAAISTATLVDVGLITVDDMSNVVDACKIKRAREKHRNELVNLTLEKFEGLYFDGKKDKTSVLSEDRSKRLIVTEEHVSLPNHEKCVLCVVRIHCLKCVHLDKI